MIVAEYHLPKENQVRCSYCEQRQKHQHGFVAEFGPRRRHLIGSTCGTATFDLQFKAAKNKHRELLDRQVYLLQLDHIVRECDALIDHCSAVLKSSSLHAIEHAGKALEVASGDFAMRLRAIDSMLFEEVRVRDLQAEANRPDDGTDDSKPKPIFRTERQAIGQLRGKAVLNHEYLRSRIYAFKTGVREIVKLENADTDTLTNSELRKAFKAINQKFEDANNAIAECNRAPNFYSAENVERIVRWAREGTTADVEQVDGKLTINGYEFAAPVIVKLDSLPSIRPA